MGIEQQEHERDRWIALRGCYNFRDLGGYATRDGRKVRWRRLFRSDGLHGLTVDDVEQLHTLGLSVVIDLRATNEIERDGRGTLFDTGQVSHHHHPFVDRVEPQDLSSYPADPVVHYPGIIDTARPAITAIFDALSREETYPAVFHCVAGKDRTGITAALVLRVLGVPDEVIVQDYALTELAMERRLAAVRTSEPTEEANPYASTPRHVLRAESETMARTLTMIDATYGSTQGFLETCSVTQTQLANVRDLLVI